MKILSTSAIIGRPALEIFRPWRSIFLSVMLLAAATFGALYVEVAQAQGVRRRHNGTDAHQRRARNPDGVMGNAASPTPTDYRVDWAKSDEGYQVLDGSIGGTSTLWQPQRPSPSRTSATTPNTRFVYVLATTKANTTANPGVAHGQRHPCRLLENR